MSNLPNSNTAPFSRANLRELFGETTLGEQATTALPRDFRAIGVSTDTRTLQAGNIFVALVGERFDGHSLIAEAVQKGASLILANNDASIVSIGAPLLRVENTLHALGELAHFHRSRFEIPVVAVAGAAGKTTTKEMIACVLAQEYTVLKTEGNFNNQVGVPLTLLRLEESHTAAVVEIGTNEPGEIEILSNIVAPTHGIITNIGKEHLEKLIDLDGVEREETALFRHLELTGGTAIINLDDERVRKQSAYMASQCTYTLAARAERKADIAAAVDFAPSGEPKMSFSYKIGKKRATADVQLNVVGLTMAQNALAAAAVGCTLGVSLGNIASALRKFVPTASEAGYGRMVVEKIIVDQHEITLFNDCYNANPTSMLAALETLRTLPKAHVKHRKIVLLGDMRELGDFAESEHVQLVEMLAGASWLDMAILTGAEMLAAYAAFAKNHSAPANITLAADAAESAEQLRTTLKAGDTLLVKGSRGMKLEEVISLLTASSSH
jgi:UDP-N-acetylmuramoyl-tripeptide--D-alanyl-D-alanine ligase